MNAPCEARFRHRLFGCQFSDGCTVWLTLDIPCTCSGCTQVGQQQIEATP